METNTLIDNINIYNITGELPNIIGVELVPQVGSRKYKFKNKNKKFLFDNIDTRYTDKIDFIVDTDYNLWFGRGHYKLNNKKPELKMAGTIKTDKNGNIIYIDNDSGHYQPNKQQFLNFINKISNKFLYRHYISEIFLFNN